MRFGDVEHSSTDTLKKRISIKAKEDNMGGLRELLKRMKSTQRDAFRGKYGNLLNLLEVEVQTSTITTLAQYYDAPLRCFTFQGKAPYIYLGQYTPVLTLSEIMKIHPMKLESKFTIKGKARGIPQE